MLGSERYDTWHPKDVKELGSLEGGRVQEEMKKSRTEEKLKWTEKSGPKFSCFFEG